MSEGWTWNRWMRVLSCCLAAGLLMSTVGCYPIESRKDPNELYQLALSGLSGTDNFTFRGQSLIYGSNRALIREPIQYHGTVKAHQLQGFQMLMANKQVTSFADRWNPLRQLEEIKNLAKTMEIDATASNRTHIVMRMRLAPEAGKMLLTQNLYDEMRKLEERKIQVQNVHSLSDADRSKLQSELGQIISTGYHKLQKMTNDMQVDSNYTLWINRSTLLPSKLYSKTKTNYHENGAPREEVVVTESKFDGYQ